MITHSRCPHYWPIHREPAPGTCTCPTDCECRHEQDGCDEAPAPASVFATWARESAPDVAFDRFCSYLETLSDPEDLKVYREHFARAREEIKARRGGKK